VQNLLGHLIYNMGSIKSLIFFLIIEIVTIEAKVMEDKAATGKNFHRLIS
jgi:hypothetical protein